MGKAILLYEKIIIARPIYARNAITAIRLLIVSSIKMKISLEDKINVLVYKIQEEYLDEHDRQLLDEIKEILGE